MKKKLMAVLIGCAMGMLLSGCEGAGNAAKPTPTAVLKPIVIPPATPTPMIASTATPTPMPESTATPKPTVTPEPTATLKPTATPTPTAMPTPTVAPTTTPTVAPTTTPTAVPTISQEPEDAYRKGIVTEIGYENEWLGIWFAALENVSISVPGDDVLMLAEWDNEVTGIQLMVEEVQEGVTEEEYLAVLVSELETDNGDGVFYQFDENLYLVEIGGQEYWNLSSVVEFGAGFPVYLDFCVREQDGYMVVLMFRYADGYEQDVETAINNFLPY